MQMSLSKKLLLLSVACVTMQSQAFLKESVIRESKRAVTVNGLFNHFIVHPVAARIIKDMPDRLLVDLGSTQLYAHEIWETLTAMVLVALNEKFLVGTTSEKAVDAAKLVAWGAALHKVVEEVFGVLGLDSYFTEEDKEMYKIYGAGYIQAILAGALDEYFHPEKYAAENAVNALTA